MRSSQISPAGLVFAGIAGKPMLPQQVTINWSASGEQVFTATPLQPPGQDWLTSDSGGHASSVTVATINVMANGTGLPPGVYTGTVSLSPISSTVGTIAPVLGAINVTMILGTLTGTPALEDATAVPAAVPSGSHSRNHHPQLRSHRTGVDGDRHSQ